MGASGSLCAGILPSHRLFQGSYPGFPGTVNRHLANPTVALTIPMEEILSVDAVIVTHTHPDHWDEAAKALVPKQLSIFVQGEPDAQVVKSSGFTDVKVLTKSTDFKGITMTKTSGQHGSDAAVAALGESWAKSAALSSSIRARKPSIWPGTPFGIPMYGRAFRASAPSHHSQQLRRPGGRTRFDHHEGRR